MKHFAIFSAFAVAAMVAASCASELNPISTEEKSGKENYQCNIVTDNLFVSPADTASLMFYVDGVDVTAMAEWTCDGDGLQYLGDGKFKALKDCRRYITAKYGDKTDTIRLEVKWPGKLECMFTVVPKNGGRVMDIVSPVIVEDDKCVTVLFLEGGTVEEYKYDIYMTATYHDIYGGIPKTVCTYKLVCKDASVMAGDPAFRFYTASYENFSCSFQFECAKFI